MLHLVWPDVVIKSDPYAIGWGEGSWALVTPEKAIRVGVG